MNDNIHNIWIKITAMTIGFLSISFSPYAYPVSKSPKNKIINTALTFISQHSLNIQITQEPTASRSKNGAETSSNTIEITPDQSSAKKQPNVTASISDVFICTDNEDGTFLIESTSFSGSTMRYFHGFDYTKPN